MIVSFSMRAVFIKDTTNTVLVDLEMVGLEASRLCVVYSLCANGCVMTEYLIIFVLCDSIKAISASKLVSNCRRVAELIRLLSIPSFPLSISTHFTPSLRYFKLFITFPSRSKSDSFMKGQAHLFHVRYSV